MDDARQRGRGPREARASPPSSARRRARRARAPARPSRPRGEPPSRIPRDRRPARTRKRSTTRCRPAYGCSSAPDPRCRARCRGATKRPSDRAREPHRRHDRNAAAGDRCGRSRRARPAPSTPGKDAGGATAGFRARLDDVGDLRDARGLAGTHELQRPPTRTPDRPRRRLDHSSLEMVSARPTSSVALAERHAIDIERAQLQLDSTRTRRRQLRLLDLRREGRSDRGSGRAQRVMQPARPGSDRRGLRDFHAAHDPVRAEVSATGPTR